MLDAPPQIAPSRQERCPPRPLLRSRARAAAAVELFVALLPVAVLVAGTLRGWDRHSGLLPVVAFVRERTQAGDLVLVRGVPRDVTSSLFAEFQPWLPVDGVPDTSAYRRAWLVTGDESRSDRVEELLPLGRVLSFQPFDHARLTLHRGWSASFGASFDAGNVSVMASTGPVACPSVSGTPGASCPAPVANFRIGPGTARVRGRRHDCLVARLGAGAALQMAIANYAFGAELSLWTARTDASPSAAPVEVKLLRGDEVLAVHRHGRPAGWDSTAVSTPSAPRPEASRDLLIRLSADADVELCFLGGTP